MARLVGKDLIENLEVSQQKPTTKSISNCILTGIEVRIHKPRRNQPRA